MDDTKKTALQAFRLMFRPLARILLRAGVNWKELRITSYNVCYTKLLRNITLAFSAIKLFAVCSLDKQGGLASASCDDLLLQSVIKARDIGMRRNHV